MKHVDLLIICPYAHSGRPFWIKKNRKQRNNHKANEILRTIEWVTIWSGFTKRAWWWWWWWRLMQCLPLHHFKLSCPIGAWNCCYPLWFYPWKTSHPEFLHHSGYISPFLLPLPHQPCWPVSVTAKFHGLPQSRLGSLYEMTGIGDESWFLIYCVRDNGDERSGFIFNTDGNLIFSFALNLISIMSMLWSLRLCLSVCARACVSHITSSSAWDF